MKIIAKTPEQYIDQVPEPQKLAVAKLREVILNNLPAGFEEMMLYDMITYVVPLALYPKGYLGKPGQPLPFISIGAQKNFIGLYHLGIYTMEPLLAWFTAEYPKHTAARLDMGKSCIRFKKPDQIPYDLIGELAARVTAREWADFYGKSREKSDA